MSTSNSRIIIGLEDRQGRIKTFFEEDAPCSHIGENWGGYIVKFIRYKNGPRKNYSYFEKIHWRFLATICLTFAWIAVYPIAGMLIPLLLSTGMEILLYCHESGLRGIIRGRIRIKLSKMRIRIKLSKIHSHCKTNFRS
ncbi:uncharacterized protein LOC129229430 [Uloborus diversus]|uniref:uncharacterized protein LOC129229430 n=1 Tax=Uloborus diversus TaxID=327109 RepID=UPI002409A51A|nr:uncharacterized protein LOC129229430 [Uloborus diversus]